MTNTPYIKRHLLHEGKPIHQDQMNLSGCVVILAEPGAGKTELLASFAKQLHTERLRANTFRNKPNVSIGNVLILDGLDEVAKVDASYIDSILSKVSTIQPLPKTIVFASRASEWENRNKDLIKDYLGIEPSICRLVAFSKVEQRAYFEAIAVGQKFEAFYQQATQIDLAPLLGNPLFLRLFSLAYLENGQVFDSKKRAFEDAVASLAKEHNPELPVRKRPSNQIIIAYAEEVFAKLLLSGAEGFSFDQSMVDSKFPFLGDLISNSDKQELLYLMDTGLFKLAESPFLYEPIHRVVAEYCAASYLVKKILATNSPLSLGRCLAVIAPNGFVRIELRGLIGWIATLGNEDIQCAIIKLDPYAVIANGDPSLLRSTSKKKLLNGLITLSETDPYFRASDQWRCFSIKGFFTADIFEATLDIVKDKNSRNNLRGLIIELLNGSSQATMFKDELKKIVLDKTENELIRKLCIEALLTIENYDFIDLLKQLIYQPDNQALELAAGTVETRGVSYFGYELVKILLKEVATLYTIDNNSERAFEKRYLIKRLVQSFNVQTAEWLLDNMSKSIVCSCKPKYEYECKCRIGISKVIGILLDRYFELKKDFVSPVSVWQWTKDIIFKHACSPSQSKSVDVLHKNDELRRSIQRIILTSTTNSDELRELRHKLNGWLIHSGLRFINNDIEHAIQFAYESGDTFLWVLFFPYHDFYSNQRGPNRLRSLMKKHSCESVDFMRKWAFHLKHEREQRIKIKIDNYKLAGRFRSKSAQRRLNANDDFISNKESILNGQNWWWLKYLSEYYLYGEKEPNYFDVKPNVEFVECALINGLNFFKSDIPNIQRLAELRISSQYLEMENVIVSAVLANFRQKHSLNHLENSILIVAIVNISQLSDLIKNEYEQIDAEINRCLFPSENHKEKFLRSYFEPQLKISGSHLVKIDILTKKWFHLLKKTLLIDWLTRFPNMPLQAMETLFAYAVSDYENRATLVALIKSRSADFKNDIVGPLSKIKIDQRTFWFLRYFYFVEDIPEYISAYLFCNPIQIFLFETSSSRLFRDEAESWPRLSADKTFQILNAFVTSWPAVVLPSGSSSEDPEDIKAYRLLSKLVMNIANDLPERSLPVLTRIIEDSNFLSFKQDALHLRATINRKQALRDFEAPNPAKIIDFFDNAKVASVEDLRQLILEKLEELQKYLISSEGVPLNAYYNCNEKTNIRVGENEARDRIFDFLKPRCEVMNVTIGIERNMANNNRCDITASLSINGKHKLLVVEVKGQWHPELFTAANEQLYERYSSHPDAADQGIYLVLWFGPDEKIADRISHGIDSPKQLQEKLLEDMPSELNGRIDVFVLDLSYPQ
jgi:hypothetical protein